MDEHLKSLLQRELDELESKQAAVQTIERLSDECETQANEIDCLRTLIRNINEVYINMDEPGLMSWDERTRMRVEIVNDVNMLLAGMENDNAHR
jgi:hypothetical protein